jgi:uncharacterized protein with PIN domain
LLHSLDTARGEAIRRSSTLGDCFAYAMAKNHRTGLLFKGDDFNKTDIPIAGRSQRLSCSECSCATL